MIHAYTVNVPIETADTGESEAPEPAMRSADMDRVAEVDVFYVALLSVPSIARLRTVQSQ